MTDRLFRFFEKTIKIIAVVPLLLLTVLVTLFRNTISFNIIETSTITGNSIKFFLLLPVVLALFAVLCLLLRRIPEKVLFWGLSLVYLAGGIYLITHIQMQMRFDSLSCYRNAQLVSEGDYYNFQFGEYLYSNPHQLGLVSYNYLLIKISSEPVFVYYVNLSWILVSCFFLWRISALLYENRPTLRKLIVLLYFSFLPQLFYLFYAYGQVPGLGCLMIAVYLTILSIKKERGWILLPALLFIAAACLLRANYLIGGIALIIICVLYAIRHRKLFFAAAAFGILLSMTVPKYLVNGCYESVADTDLSQGMPPLLYIAMGLQENDPPWRAAGWYNGFNDNTYWQADCDPKTSSVLAMDAIRDRVRTFTGEPKYALDFFGEKIITTWCEPTYQSIWSGPLTSLGNTSEIKWLNSLYSGETVFRVLAHAMNYLNIIIFSFSLIYVLWSLIFGKKPLNLFELFCVLFFLGGFLFHLFWETKCQYVYPHVMFLLPLAADGIYTAGCAFVQRLSAKSEPENEPKIQRPAA